MELDPQAGPLARPDTINGVARTTPPQSTPPIQPPPQTRPGAPIGVGRRAHGAALSPHLVQTQNAAPAISSPVPATSQGLALAPPDQKRPRACESCRGLKVRCEPNELNPLATCKRCAKASRACIFTAPSRKRQKKSDSKVAELEKKIYALTASLKALTAAHAGDDDDDDEDDYLDDGDTPVVSDMPKPDAALDPSSILRHAKRRRNSDATGRDLHPFLGPNTSKVPTTSHIRPTDADAHKYVYLDVVDRKLLSMETATSIFNHYVEDMVPHFPAVVFPPGTTAEDVRRKKPTLFLAILSAASGAHYPDLHRTLYWEISRTFAERVMVNGEKTLELVQALVLCTMWYFIPDHYVELKFYMYIHLAAVMALDIGIAKKNKPMRVNFRELPSLQPKIFTEPRGNNMPEDINNEWQHGSSSLKRDENRPPTNHAPVSMPRMPFPDPEAIESRRTLLACYWTCCNVSMAQRRPNLLRYTKFMSECVEVLENSPDAAPSDRVLCQWVKLQKIAEEIGIGFAFDDPNAVISIEDASVQFSLNGFASQLEEWKSKCPPEALHESLELAYNMTVAYAHEIALHRDHNVDDFKPPFTESMMRVPPIRPNVLLSSCHIKALSRCLTSSHRVLQIFMNMSISAVRSVPVFTFVRTNYACVILVKLYFSASHPRSELGKVIDKESLKADEYMRGLLEMFRKAGDGGLSRQAQTFTVMLTMMRHWFNKQKAEIEKGVNAAPEPMISFKRLGLEEKEYGGRFDTGGYCSSSSAGPMEGMETPASMDDVSSAGTPRTDQYYDSMRPPPRRPPSVATPLHMLSNAALESSHGAGQHYGTPATDISTPRPSPQMPYTGYPTIHGDDPGTPAIADGGMHFGHIGEESEYNHGSRIGMGGDGDGIGVGVGVGVGAVEPAGEIGNYVPQYLFTGNGEMFMDDTFWEMMDGPMNMFDLVGKY